MTWLAIRLLRPYLIVAAVLSAAAAGFLLHAAGVVQRQLDARGLPHCVNPNLCWPTGPAMNAILGMELVAAFVPPAIGLILGVPLFAREREDGSAAFALTQSVSRQRWVVTKLICTMAAAATCTAVVATTYRLVCARYTLLANDLYELLELLHRNHIGFMVTQTVLVTAVAAVIGLSTGRTPRTLLLSLIWWPFGVISGYAGAGLLSYPLALLPIHPGAAAGAGLTPDDDRYWTADISYADGFGYAATVVLLAYTLVVVLIGRRTVRRAAC